MVEGTRVARIHTSVASARSTEGTVCPRPSSLRTLARRDVSRLFEARQRMMASAVKEERRPGLFVFAAHFDFGHVGRLWLEASEAPRAGFIGRHDHVDLALPLDDALSLRHLMFVVRKRADDVELTAVDLSSSSGLQLESGDAVRRVSTAGPLVLCASDFVFFCIPTGQPLPWNPGAERPWGSFTPRQPRAPTARQLADARIEGTVELGSAFGFQLTALTRGALERGVLVGRATRCDVVTPLESISRVHAVLLRLDGEVYLFDAGSTNGTWRLDREVKREPLQHGVVLMLGAELTLCWRERD